MDRMPTPELDKFFGVEDAAEKYKRYAQQDVQAGRADPREYYRYSNRATAELCSTFSRWTGVPDNNRNQWKCVAKLLTEWEDLDLINEAIRNLANKGRIYQAIDMYYMRKLVSNETARLKNMGGRERYASDVQDTGDTQKYLKGLGYETD